MSVLCHKQTLNHPTSEVRLLGGRWDHSSVLNLLKRISLEFHIAAIDARY